MTTETIVIHVPSGAVQILDEAGLSVSRELSLDGAEEASALIGMVAAMDGEDLDPSEESATVSVEVPERVIKTLRSAGAPIRREISLGTESGASLLLLLQALASGWFRDDLGNFDAAGLELMGSDPDAFIGYMRDKIDLHARRVLAVSRQ